MNLSLFAAPEREPSSLVGFAGRGIETCSEERDEESLDNALRDPSVRIMLAQAGRLIVKFDGAQAVPWHGRETACRLAARLDEAVLLGFSGQGPVAFAPCGLEPDALPQDFKAIDYRSLLNQALLDDEGLAAVAQGGALLAWHDNSRHCGRCGARTAMRIGGYKRACPSCGAEFFPRTDPVAIMLTVTRERCLLGRSPHFGPSMYSALAGFIEPGETIEEAVRRETFEEAGIRLGRVVYHASQPWPFPHSLMIGCFGEALTEEVRFDTAELADCRWFPREEVHAMIAGTHPAGLEIPPPRAIASHLIRNWAASG